MIEEKRRESTQFPPEGQCKRSKWSLARLLMTPSVRGTQGSIISDHPRRIFNFVGRRGRFAPPDRLAGVLREMRYSHPSQPRIRAKLAQRTDIRFGRKDVQSARNCLDVILRWVWNGRCDVVADFLVYMKKWGIMSRADEVSPTILRGSEGGVGGRGGVVLLWLCCLPASCCVKCPRTITSPLCLCARVAVRMKGAYVDEGNALFVS